MSGERQIRNRHFVAVATDKFNEYPDLSWVANEVGLITNWFTGADLGDRKFTAPDPELPVNPRLEAVEAVFRGTSHEHLWNWNNAAVVYITGHGDREPDSFEHYLVLQGTQRDRLSRSAVRTQGLLEWLAATDIEDLLVIIDVCDAGQVIDEVVDLVNKKRKDRWLILPSSLKDQQAQQGALAGAIVKYLKAAATYNTNYPYLTVGLFVDILNQLLDSQNLRGIYNGKLLGYGQDDKHDSDQHICLPNPAYNPHDELVPLRPAVQELALPERFLRLHNRVSGQLPSADRPGWLFTGRELLMRELAKTVRKPGVTIVTGSAGSGKSAALSCLVTLSDPGFQGQWAQELAGVPDELMRSRGRVKVAFPAQGRDNWQVLTRILHDLGLPASSSTWDKPLKANQMVLGDFLRSSQEPVTTIVIDGLDEGETRPELVSSVLIPLVRDHQDRLCLLLGVRSFGRDSTEANAPSKPERDPLGDLLAPELGARLIVVDDDRWWNQADLTTFVRNILTNTENSPYREARPAAVDKLADVISARARRSYLVARIAAESAADQAEILAPDDPILLASLSEGLLGVFRQDVQQHLPPDDWRRGVVLLRALAFTRGTGLPRHLIWPAVADALESDAGPSRSYSDRDIGWLLRSRLSAHLRTAQRDHLTVYRLEHDELRDILRYRWRELLTPADATTPPSADEAEIRAVEARIADELYSLARVRTSASVNRYVQPYIRRRLAEHALAGSRMDECVQPALLPYLDLARLRRAVGASPERRQLEETIPWLPVIRQATHLWDWNRPARNAAAIAMWAKLNEPDLPGPAKEAGSVGGPWQVDWAVRPLDLSDVLGHHNEIVRAVATAQLAGRPIAVTGGEDGLLSVWDLKTGALYRDRAPIEMVTADGKKRAILAVAAAQLAGGPTVAVTGGADGNVRIWDLKSGLAIGEPLTISGEKIVAVMVTSLPDQRVAVTAADEPGTVRSWDLATGEPIGDPLACGERNALGLTSALIDGQLLGLTTGTDSGLQLWDLVTGRPAGDRLTGHPLGAAPGTRTFQGGPVVAAFTQAARNLAITGNGDGLLLWDLRERTAIRDRLSGGDGPIRSLAMARLDDGRVLAVTGGSTTVQVWDLTAGEPVGGLLPGHDGSVDAIAMTAMSDGSALAISGSRDTSVRTWEVPDAAVAPRRPSQQIGIVEAVATAQLSAERSIAVTGSGATVQVWDLRRGGDPVWLAGHESPVVSVTTADLPGGVLIAAGHWDGWISAWWAADGTPVAPSEVGDLGAAASVAMATLGDGRPVVLAGGWDGEIRLWDPLAGASAGEPLRGHTDIVVAVRVATSAEGRTLVVSGSKDGHVLVHDLGAHLDSAPPADPVPPALVDADTGAEVASLAVLEGEHPRIVVGGEDGQVRLLDLRDGTPAGPNWQWEACPGPVAAVAAGRVDDRYLVFTGGEDALIQGWDVGTGQPDSEIHPVPAPVSAMTPVSEALPVPGPVLSMAFQAELSDLVVAGTGVAVARLRQGDR